MRHLTLGMKPALLFLLLGLQLAGPATAADTPPGGSQDRAARDRAAHEPSPLPALPADSHTSHTVVIGGRPLSYTATAGTIALKDDKGEANAQLFYVAYSVDPPPGPVAGKPGRRPLTFAFNGGPGAASVFLNLAAVGPRLLPFGNGARFASDTGDLIDNGDSWLAFTDLVFVDPVGTGYSRTPHGTDEEGRQFWGVRQDIDSLGKFIEAYLAQTNRYASPKFLLGESYGGFRVARLIGHLAEENGVTIDGAVMISPVLDYELMGGNDLELLPWAIKLPSMVATEVETSGRLGTDQARATLAEAEEFSLHGYLAGLAEGPRSAGARALYARISGLTGLAPAIVTQAEGRISIGRFAKNHAGPGRVASLYDATITGLDPFPEDPNPRGSDPILEASEAPLATAFLRYARDDLAYRTDRPYYVLNEDVGRRWDYQSGIQGHQGYVQAASSLRQAIASNPQVHILVAHGYADLVTPYMGSRYIAAHLPMPQSDGKSLPALQVKVYPGGHMVYLRPGSRAALAHDAAALYPETAPSSAPAASPASTR